ncbi:AAA family ATPase [Microbacterium flavescens]|uniref:AAA family ATPase n=1 Tax=Microbacterium flavescens TaxID=69366 RepID=UPI001BDDF7EA|nr:AAA family ATPase [Microbacterium flavescens]
MKLTAVYARFFRSLNFDFMKRSSPGYIPLPWDDVPGGLAPYPFVKVTLDPHITTVVGANESGKSQVLAAIEFGLTGDKVLQRDFCRYSPFFLRHKDLLLPEFGLRFNDLSVTDLPLLGEVIGQKVEVLPDELAYFRMNTTPKTRIYLRHGEQWTIATVKKPTALEQLGMPSVFKIDAGVPLPDSVPIKYVASGQSRDAMPHAQVRSGLELLFGQLGMLSSPSDFEANRETLRSNLTASAAVVETDLRKFELARTLLLDVAGLNPDLFDQLSTAIGQGKSGYATSIVDTINSELSHALNFKHWWRQDQHFELFVEHQEFHLDFMIRDRTGRTYSFDERSGGLKYFLSYFVQYLAHVANAAKEGNGARPEILLMDEPDAYLSSSGQQDLLRIFEAFAFPQDSAVPAVQVVYVTHSPFLIDKNHAERLRVLDKGRHDEGTRVVANAARNHYEPLRSALGELVAETTFMGGCNLILEGASDQVLIAGMSGNLRLAGVPESQNLNLNDISLVPAGSASHVPYMAFLARGRDVDKPAVIVLLDSDAAGDQAVAKLRKGGPNGKQLVDPQFVRQLNDITGFQSDNPGGVVGIEDLVPLDVALDAVRRYVAEFVTDANVDKLELDPKLVFATPGGTLDRVATAVRDHLSMEDFHLDKIAFARHVVAAGVSDAVPLPARERLAANFSLLLRELATVQRKALRTQSSELIKDRVNRIRDRFQTDYPVSAPREAVLLLIEEIDSQLDDSAEADEVRAVMATWTREYSLSDAPREPVDDYEGFLEAFAALPYAGAVRVQTASQ